MPPATKSPWHWNGNDEAPMTNAELMTNDKWDAQINDLLRLFGLPQFLRH